MTLRHVTQLLDDAWMDEDQWLVSSGEWVDPNTKLVECDRLARAAKWQVMSCVIQFDSV